MVSKREVMLWYLNNFMDKDPRGESPSLFHVYDYKRDDWVLFFQFIE